MANATVLFDQTPDTGTVNQLTWINQSNGQNFADIVELNQSATVTDYDLFTTNDPSTYGQVQVNLYADNGGIPGSVISSQVVDGTNYFNYGTYNGINIYEIDLALTNSWSLSANTVYWAGASGYNYDIGQVSLTSSSNPHSDGVMAQFGGNTYGFMTGVGDQAFALEGRFVPAPEPASMAALGMGLVGLIARKRRK